jgi:hypothetical protein
VAATTAEKDLAWEARMRPRAAAAAIAGGVLTVAGGIFNSLALRDAPRALFLDSLAKVAQPGPIGSAQSTRIPAYQFFQDHIAAIIVGAVLLGLASLAAAGALTFLAFATRARAERFPRVALYLPVVGGVLVLVGSVITAVGSLVYVGELLDTNRTVDALQDLGQSPVLVAGQIIVQFGGLAMAGAYVLVALNAMRVGLLTRAMGVIGLVVGLLVVLPVALLSQLLQPLWLFALSWMLLDRWPGGAPPAWRTGRAEPWPTNAQLREQRDAARAKQAAQRGRGRGAAEEEPAAAATAVAERPAGRPHPASKKRKRKRRD